MPVASAAGKQADGRAQRRHENRPHLHIGPLPNGLPKGQPRAPKIFNPGDQQYSTEDGHSKRRNDADRS